MSTCSDQTVLKPVRPEQPTGPANGPTLEEDCIVAVHADRLDDHLTDLTTACRAVFGSLQGSSTSLQTHSIFEKDEMEGREAHLHEVHEI